MNLKSLLFLCAILCIVSCSKETESGDGDGGSGTITQDQLANLKTSCLSTENSLKLPAPMTVFENYASDEYAAEVWGVMTASNAFVAGFTTGLFPSALAVTASSEGITKFGGQRAYVWGQYPEKYAYVETDSGYEVYLFVSEDDSEGLAIITVEQSDDCTDFRLQQREEETDGVAERGTVIFSFEYRKTDIEYYEYTDVYYDGSVTYSSTSLPDLSGSLVITDSFESSVVSITWDTEGDGVWEKVIDGEVVESGSWDF